MDYNLMRTEYRWSYKKLLFCGLWGSRGYFFILIIPHLLDITTPDIKFLSRLIINK